ESEDEFYQQLL
ncbi:unnamed protein product, partial [Adineta steineri]